MRRQAEFKKNKAIKGMAIGIVICMMLGSMHMTASAEERDETKLPELESRESLLNDQVPDEDKDESKLDTDSVNNEKTNEGTEEDQEPVVDDNIEEKEPEAENEDDDNKTVSGNDIGKKEPEPEETEEETENNEEQETPEIVNVVVPSVYTLALNPYSLPIRIGEEEITTEQVISGTYGIVNKSSTDQIVKVTLTVEDGNGEELVFVDSAEEARDAEAGVYAVYLAAVPANEEEILIDGLPADANIVGESLQNVRMDGAQEQAVTLYAGENQIAFKLGGAVYYSENKEEEFASDNSDEDDLKGKPEMILDGLAPDGSGVTAYTFCGAMNPNAPWEKLSGGIKISVVYTYWMADGNEEIIEGTGAMIRPD